MTVCIAAVCRVPVAPGQPIPVQPYMIVGAADRMLTAGDIEYEPPRWKVWMLGQNAAALISGDAAIQNELWDRTNAEVMSGATPTLVRRIADTYARHFANYRRTEAERKFLTPIGLDTNEFLRRQREMSPEIVERITAELWAHSLEEETIICGIDPAGAQIYVVGDPGYVSVHTGIGFAAVGIGQKHAESEFMFSRYAFDWSFERALLLTYTAKKRAQTAPGVGIATDMFLVNPSPFAVTQIPDPLVNELDKIYRATQQQIQDAQEEGHKKIEQFIQQLLATPQQQPQPQQQQASQQPETPPPPPRRRRRGRPKP